ncbi:MAG: hypothetical protein JW955_00545 [Sedimentisphaerales bacterium]|nr:hypothetical protein [Sedimentisphaerales bacterium]
MTDTRETAPPSAGGDSWKMRTRRIARKTVGVILIVLGVLALLTPLTPGSWLIPIGLELVGLRLLLQDKLLTWAERRPDSRVSKVIRRLMHVRKGGPGAWRKWRRSRTH